MAFLRTGCNFDVKAFVFHGDENDARSIGQPQRKISFLRKIRGMPILSCRRLVGKPVGCNELRNSVE